MSRGQASPHAIALPAPWSGTRTEERIVGTRPGKHAHRRTGLAAAGSALLHGAGLAAVLWLLHRTPPAEPAAERGVEVVWEQTPDERVADAQEPGAPPPPANVEPPGTPPPPPEAPPSANQVLGVPPPPAAPAAPRLTAELPPPLPDAAALLPPPAPAPAPDLPTPPDPMLAEVPPDELPLPPPPAPPPPSPPARTAALARPTPAPAQRPAPPAAQPTEAPPRNAPAAEAAPASPPGTARAEGSVVPPGLRDGQAGPPPRYPDSSRQRGEQGVVALAIRISETGAVLEVEIARSSGFPALDAAARDAVERWRFRPALRDGKPVPGNLRTSVHFRLQ